MTTGPRIAQVPCTVQLEVPRVPLKKFGEQDVSKKDVQRGPTLQ